MCGNRGFLLDGVKVKFLPLPTRCLLGLVTGLFPLCLSYRLFSTFLLLHRSFTTLTWIGAHPSKKAEIQLPASYRVYTVIDANLTWLYSRNIVSCTCVVSISVFLKMYSHFIICITTDIAMSYGCLSFINLLFIEQHHKRYKYIGNIIWGWWALIWYDSLVYILPF